MKFHETILFSLRSLRHNPLRSFLTILGIVIGVASVVTVLAIGSGAQEKVASEIRAVGSNVLMINPGAAREAGIRLKAGTRLTLTESDVAAIVHQIPQIIAAAGSLSGSAQAVHENQNWNTTINGTTMDHFVVRNWSLSSGRGFSGDEMQEAGKVAILGSSVVKELYGAGADPVGSEIRIMNVPFEVIGVLASKGQNQDDVIFVPLSTAKLRFMGSASGVNRDAVAYIIAKTAFEEDIPVAKERVEKLLRQRHRLMEEREDDFKVTDPAAEMDAQRNATHTVAVLLASIACVSLFVGGISIMNIMIVSVTERTREIGIRRAVGARSQDIRLQFLVEALVLCIVGGLIGVAVGIILSLTVARSAGWPTMIDAQAICLAVWFAAVIGVFFGFYPADRASRIDPVKALKVD
ncbi:MULTISPECIES: ABC transporter permease [unclassified Beijerinckia]|uniref:ABC transporter permease n=1 Tax=unclassified Beijerinckia TaxID=2638183 RepID=UPI000897821D|nr:MULTISPECIES: ABC transporter permease [unclassified Beijerinckia]MDH7797538.1 putative ABC transport system permease protein [Beijerinckia sp. GAS462]SEC89639.1 putative ABC transport system permease protein [Beijerinckia sp. 28-YEA-48]